MNLNLFDYSHTQCKIQMILNSWLHSGSNFILGHLCDLIYLQMIEKYGPSL
jgi:hypothetical protein